MFCPKCGHENEENTVFCPRCGKSPVAEYGESESVSHSAITFIPFVLGVLYIVVYYTLSWEYDSIWQLLFFNILIFASYSLILLRLRALRRRYIFMTDGERESAIAEYLTSHGELPEKAYSQATVLSRLFRDTLLWELPENERQRLMSCKAAKRFLRRVCIPAAATRRPYELVDFCCPACAEPAKRGDVYCFRCGAYIREKSGLNIPVVIVVSVVILAVLISAFFR